MEELDKFKISDAPLIISNANPEYKPTQIRVFNNIMATIDYEKKIFTVFGHGVKTAGYKLEINNWDKAI